MDLSPWLDTVLAIQEFEVEIKLSLLFTTIQPEPVIVLEFEGVGNNVLTPW